MNREAITKHTIVGYYPTSAKVLFDSTHQRDILFPTANYYPQWKSVTEALLTSMGLTLC